MVTPTIEAIKKHIQEHHRYIPLGIQLSISHEQWIPLYKTLTAKEKYHILLESGRTGRYSFFGYQPTHRLYGKNRMLTITQIGQSSMYTRQLEMDQLNPEFVISLDPKLDIYSDSKQDTRLEEEKFLGNLLDSLKLWMNRRQAPYIPELPDFRGGLMGFISYDLIREIEELPEQSSDDLNTPDVYFLAFEQIIAYDHEKDQHWLLVHQPIQGKSVGNEDQMKLIENAYQIGLHKLQNWKKEIETILGEPSFNVLEEGGSYKPEAPLTSESDKGEITPSFSESEFVEAVEKIQEYIAAGDVFQVNLSVRQSRQLETSPLRIYEELRKINPSPYMGYLHYPEFQIVSASPEQLIKKQGRAVNTRPIAGTRPRGKDRDEDLKLAQELIDNEKERAEHVMLVDLERNDLGKVCEYGSVHVNEFMIIEEYSHVMHIVSNVQGILQEDKDAFDVVRAVFPGGTITGAPKVRTMEIIEELERVRRGIYTGSIGWIDYNGDMELNIVIRTLLALEGQAHVQAGAGIVIDSKTHSEYKESLNKAIALWRAYEQS